MANMEAIISGQNRKLLLENLASEQAPPTAASNQNPGCNCRGEENKANFPMDGKCKAKSIVYKAEVTAQSQQPTSTYIGLTANKFKDRYYGHKYSMQHIGRTQPMTSTREPSYPGTSGTSKTVVKTTLLNGLS